MTGSPGKMDGDSPMHIAEFQQLIRDRYYATDSARPLPRSSGSAEVGELA
jgi:hypothetical protein